VSWLPAGDFVSNRRQNKLHLELVTSPGLWLDWSSPLHPITLVYPHISEEENGIQFELVASPLLWLCLSSPLHQSVLGCPYFYDAEYGIQFELVACPRNHRDRHSRRGGVGFVLPAGTRGPFENGAEVAVQRGVDLAALGAGRERDALDEGSEASAASSRSCGRWSASESRSTLRR